MQNSGSNLIEIFEKPELDFSSNRAEGDDILGDAYPKFMTPNKFSFKINKLTLTKVVFWYYRFNIL